MWNSPRAPRCFTATAVMAALCCAVAPCRSLAQAAPQLSPETASAAPEAEAANAAQAPEATQAPAAPGASAPVEGSVSAPPPPAAPPAQTSAGVNPTAALSDPAGDGAEPKPLSLGVTQPYHPRADAEPSVPSPAHAASSRGARAELATVQTLVGAAMGVELCLLAECEEPRGWAGAMLIGAGSALTLSLATTRDGIPSSRAQAANAGALWGTWLGGAAFGIAVEPDIEALGGVLIGGQLLGAGTGVLLEKRLHLTAGEVSLASSAGLWTGLASLFALGGIEPDGDNVGRKFLATTVGTTSLAMVGGAYLARKDHVSRGRALLVDLGAITGGGALPLVTWLIRGDDASGEGLFWSGAIGVVGGAVTAYVLTRHWDLPRAPDVGMSLTPVQGGAIGQVTFKTGAL